MFERFFAGARKQSGLSEKELFDKYELNKIKLPAGFMISIYAEVPDARSMCWGAKGTLFVGNRDRDKVYAVVDNNHDGRADKVYVIASGLNMPCGVAFRNGSLYVAEVSRILRYDNIETRLANPPTAFVVYDKLPTEKHHGWKFIAFGPDGKLYVPVGAPFNIGEPDAQHASLFRMNDDGTGLEKFASGIRNTVGFAWHPATHELWFTDNGRDMLGDDIPPDELNTAPKAGMNFGYPYFHAGTIKDPEFGGTHSASEFTAPAMNLGAHVAALGLKFYTATMFPVVYRNQIFIAEHGSWNRTKKSGYRITLVKIENGKAKSYEPFATGWLNEATQVPWGRPADLLILPDGSMLVSDDMAGVIYRISYKK